MLARRELFEFAIRQSSDRIAAAADLQSEKSEAQLRFSAALGETLWWQAAYDEFLDLNRYQSDPQVQLLAQAVRFARNTLTHGVEPWSAAATGLSFPLQFPVHFGWNWRELAKPDNERTSWKKQWRAYTGCLVGRDVVESLAEHRRVVLDLAIE